MSTLWLILGMGAGVYALRLAGLALPDVEESTAYGKPALKTGGQLITCPAINKSAEPNSLAVRVSFETRDELIAEAPDTYYVTDFYRSYPLVLVRLSHVDRDALHDLLSVSWRLSIAKTRRGPRRALR